MRVALGRYSLEVEDHGAGMPLVLLHGFPLAGEIFAPMRPALEQVARVITPDLRGFGRSDKPAGDYSIASLADDVVAVADRLGFDRFVLGGHSMGGYITLHVAATHSERLAGMLLLNSRAEADTAEAAGRRRNAIAGIHQGGGAVFLNSFVPNLVGPTTRDRAPRFLAELRAIAADVPDHVLIACQEGMLAREDRTALLGTLDVPTLIVAGEEDGLIPVESAQAMAAALPHGRLVTIAGAGHTAVIERPIAVSDAVVSFLRSL
ncbi:MAG: alpha/beta fold hydrolase [Acidobacteriota bacterium]